MLRQSAQHYLLSLSVIFLLILASINIERSLITPQVLGASTPDLSTDRIYWERVIEEHPTYRDGFLQLAQIYLLEGDRNKATEAIQKAKTIDPNSVKIKSLVKDLGL